MGVVSHGMLWCYCFTNFVKSLYCYCQNGQTKSPDLSLLAPKSFIHQMGKKKKKSSPAFANLWLLLVL